MVANDEWVCMVPFWAAWPYETMLIPLKHTLRFNDLTDSQREGKSTYGYYLDSMLGTLIGWSI